MGIQLAKAVKVRTVQEANVTTITPVITIFNHLEKTMRVTIAETDAPITIQLTDAENAAVLTRLKQFADNHL